MNKTIELVDTNKRNTITGKVETSNTPGNRALWWTLKEINYKPIQTNKKKENTYICKNLKTKEI